MAKKRYNSKKKKGRSIQPAITDLYFKADVNTQGDSRCYIDTAKELSKVNRRLYSQSRMYGYQGLTFIWKAQAAIPDPAQTLTTIEVTVATAGNSWIVQNAHVKGHALWNQMQDLVLDDNPSVKGKWHDFKIVLVDAHDQTKQLAARDGAGNLYAEGEWNYSTFVMPQHEVDPATGEPLAAVDFEATLIGPDLGVAGKRSLVKAYQDSRATVQADMPNVPAAFTDSFFNLLTDSGSQEPELATVIEAENDNPPYSLEEYPGAETNAPEPVVVQYGAISQSEVDGRVGGFVAPCGLLEITIKGYDQDGLEFPRASMPVIDLLLHVAPGSYKGTAAIPMGQ
jgi:hypothetical protein